MQIYLYINEQQVGPYSGDQIQGFLIEGQVTSETLAWSEGNADWVPISTLMPPAPTSPPAILPQLSPVTPTVKCATQPPTAQNIAVYDSTVKKALEYLSSILVLNEKIETWAIQTRLHGLLHRRSVVATTTGRFIVLKRGFFGGFKMGDIRWQDMHDSKIQVGIFTASIKVIYGGIADMASWSTAAGNAVIQGLRKEQAQAVYRICQAQDQAWREKRRIREMEEMRARSGTFTQNGYGGDSSLDSMTRLQQAKQMLDASLISDSEYEAMKARIISSM